MNRQNLLKTMVNKGIMKKLLLSHKDNVMGALEKFEQASGKNKESLGREINENIKQFFTFYDPFGAPIDFLVFCDLRNEGRFPSIPVLRFNHYLIETEWHGGCFNSFPERQGLIYLSYLHYEIGNNHHMTKLLHSRCFEEAQKCHYRLFERAKQMDEGFDYSGLDCIHDEHYINGQPFFREIDREMTLQTLADKD